MWAHFRQFGLPGRRTWIASVWGHSSSSSLLHRLAEPAATLRGGADPSWIAIALTLRLQDANLAAYLTFLHHMAPKTAQQFDQELKPYDIVPQ